tara:strand:- start:2125 stop:3387 length:1263 start_codon:yes stop_codon:yes gene_type:complete
LNALSHETEGLSFADSNKALEKALEKLHPDRLIVTDRNGKNTLQVKFRGESIYLNRSVMLAALNEIYNELSEELTKEEKIALEETKLSVFSYLSQKTITIVKTPYLFFKDLVLNLPEHMSNLSLTLPKYYHSRGPTALVVIGVTQVAWETLETAISWAIGAGGAHAYCVVFNIALLKAVDNAKGLFSFLTARGTKMSALERLRLFVLALKRDWRDGKGILKTLKKSNRTLKIESLKEVANQFGLNRVSTTQGKAETVLLEESFRISKIREMNITNRLWHSYQINLGIEYLSYMLEEHIKSFTEKNLHDFEGTKEQKKEIYKSIWKLKTLEGKLIKFKESLKFAVTASMFDLKTESSRLSLAEYYRQYIDLVTKTVGNLQKDPLLVRHEIISLSEEVTRKFEYIKKTTYSFSISSCLRLII